MELHAQVGALARGCAFLGSGGGGSTRVYELLLAGQGIADIEFRPAASDDDPVAVALFGSVDVFAETLPTGNEAVKAVRALERWTGRDFTGVVPLQIGGTTALIAAHAALGLHKDMLDADLVGRAVQTLRQITVGRTGEQLAIGAASPTGQTAVLGADDADHLERLARSLLAVSGGWLVLALAPQHRALLSDELITGSLSAAAEVGRLLNVKSSDVSMRRYSGMAPRLRGSLGIHSLATGRIRNHTRYQSSLGTEVESYLLRGENGAVVRIEATSEFLVAVVDGQVAARAPAIIQVVDRLTLRPIMVQDLRIGNEVVVLTRDAPSWWRDRPAEIRRVRPTAYGLEEPCDEGED